MKKSSTLLPYDTTNPKNPVWDLYKHGITFSGLSKWLSCREQFRLQYVCGWTSTKFSAALEFGSLFHDCLEHEDKTRTGLVKFLKAWRAKRLKTLTMSDMPQLEDCITRAMALVPEYFAFYQKKDKNVEWYEREHQFFTKVNLPDGREIPIAGKIDGVIKNGKWFKLFETKTASRISEGTLSNRLKMDFQILYYANAAEIVHGKRVSSVGYNVIRKSQHKQAKAETAGKFTERLRQEIQKDPDHYFKRWNISLQKKDLERFRKTVVYPILDQFSDWYQDAIVHSKNPFESSLHFINPNELEGKYGPSPVLKLITEGNTEGLEIRTKAHPELD